MSVQIDTISWVEPSFGRFGERFLEGPKVVIKDVSRRERSKGVLQAEDQHLERHSSMNFLGVCHGKTLMLVILVEVPHARKAIVKKSLQKLKLSSFCSKFGLY